MAIYDTVKGNIPRQELQLIEAGQHYKVYSAKVKFLPENVEKEGFFNLCYGMLKKCDEINVYTVKTGDYEVFYKFMIVDADMENKTVTARLLSKVDFSAASETVETTNEGSAISLADVKKLIKDSLKNELTLEVVKELIGTEIKSISEVVADIDAKLEIFNEATIKYQEETDDQLEEIEAKLEGLDTTKEVETTKSEQTDNKSKATTKAKSE